MKGERDSGTVNV